jgi:predicted metal-dependent HD superfamily phosphohydrolase
LSPFLENIIARCEEQTLTSKVHQECMNSDTSFFTDADLAILGSDWTTYSAYRNGIRVEYFMFSDDVYYAWRKRALEQFLKIGKLFKTDIFYNAYENKARSNIMRKLGELIFT